MPRSKKIQSREEFQVFEQYLAENGLKHSRQREIILEHFLSNKGHMTVDDLYQIIQRTHPEIGRTTIYRTLKLLCDAALAEAIELKDGLTRFEHLYNNEHHDHMICTECGAIIEFTNGEIERLQEEVARAHGFSPDSHRHQIFGVCRSCNRRRRPKNNRSKNKSRRTDYSLLDAEPTPPLS